MAKDKLKTGGAFPNETNDLALKHFDALISKMIDTNNTTSNKNTNMVNLSNFGMIPMHTMKKIETNDDILQLFPDMEIAIKILVSSILAPQDMFTTKLNYTINKDILPSTIRDTLLSNIKEYLESEYDLIDNLPVTLKEAIFSKGAYAEAIIPEAAIDEIVNNDIYKKLSNEARIDALDNKTEGYIQASNVYDDNYKLTIEAYGDDSSSIETIDLKTYMDKADSLISITDNPSILAISKENKDDIFDKLIEMELKTYGMDLSTENFNNIKSIFRKPQYGATAIELSVPDESSTHRKSVGKPLTYHIPTEAIIPVHSYGDPSNHLGYYVVLDESGAPLSIESQLANYSDIDMYSKYNGTATGDSSSIIHSIKASLQGLTQKAPLLKNIEEVYSATLQNMLEAKIKKGVLGDKATLEQANDIYRVMFFRALKQLKTRVLFLPAQLVVYYAYDYRENGTGKSLLEKVSVLASIRSIMLFSRLMSSVKNSINTTTYNVDLDELDPDPNSTRVKVMSEALKSRISMLPIGLHRIDDISTWSQTAGTRFHFNHKDLPSMTIEQSNDSPNKVLPDTELADDITEQIFMTFGMNKEIVNGGFNAEFAATIIQNNILFRKRVAEYQAVTNKHDTINGSLSEIKKHMKDKQDGTINVTAIKNDEVLARIISLMIAKDMVVSLPAPEVDMDDANIKKSFDSYKALIDEYLPLIINEESLNSDVIGEYFDNIEQLHNVIKTILYKDWMARTGLLPEISKFLTLNENEEPLYNILDEFGNHTDNLLKVLSKFMKDKKNMKN